MIELLIVIVIIMILVSFLIGGVIRSQHEARYTRWHAYSRDLRNDGDLHAYYTFENGNGDYLENVATGDPGDIDYRPADYDGTIVGAQWRPNEGRWTGKNGLLFDGIDDYVALNLNASEGEYDELTVMAWVRPIRDTNMTIISLDGDELWELGATKIGGDLTFDWTTTDTAGTTSKLQSPPTFSPGNWYLVAGWYSKHGVLQDVKVFVNGERVAHSKQHHGNPLGKGDRTTTYAYIGVDSKAATAGGDRGSAFFAGMVDEIIIFRRALTEQEIIDFFKMGSL